MDLKYYIAEFQKQKIISHQFQIKLGELIIYMTNNQLNYNDEQIRITIKLLQEFLCHRHYIEYINLSRKDKPSSHFNSNNQIEDSTSSLNTETSSNNYDNCMNLLLVVLAKIAKLSTSYSILMIDYFVEHITSHIECFNYIISFYRLYISCAQIKSASKEYELYNNLFEFYKRMYYISLKYENIDSYNLKDLKKLVNGAVTNLNNDKKYFLDQFRSKNSEATSNTSNLSDNSRHVDKSPESILITNLRRDKTEEKLRNQKFSIFNPFKNQQKTQVSSKTERRISNVNVSGNKSTNSDNNLKNLNQKSSTEIEINIENLKKKVPNLRLPINIIDQHFSLTRSSRRADFSASATSKKLQEKSNLLNIKRDSNEPIIIQDKEKSIISNLKEADEKEVSPIEKLKTIAFQLGESCLATDLSCLINQKRDLELEKLAREKMGKKDSVITLISNNSKKPSEFDYIEKLKYSSKLESDYEIENKDNLVNQEIKSCNDRLPENNIFVSSNNPNINEITKDFKQKFIFTFESHIDINYDKNYKNYLKIREILSNFILSCIREYSIEEIHLVKISFNMIYCYLILPSIDQMRKKIEKKKLDNFETEYEIDYRNVLTEGSLNILDKDNNKASFYLGLDKLQSEDQNRMKQNNFVSRDKSSFDSLMTINYEEEKGSQLSLRSEYESLVELLVIHFSSIENNLKQQNFFKQLYESVENPEPEKTEFWCEGIRFSSFQYLTQDKVRKHCDGFFDKIRNRITFILKHYDFKSSNDIWKTLILNLITLRDYISNVKSRIISTFVLLEFMEILVILKKNFIIYFSNIANFEFTSDDIKFVDKLENDYIINNEIIEMFSVYLDLLSKLIQNSNLIISDKLLNESFIICPSFLEIIRFVVIYLFTHDIYDKLELSITNTNVKNSNNNMSLTVSTRKFSAKKLPRFTLINFLKEIDAINNIDMKSNVLENYKFFVSTALTIVNYFNTCSLFFHKIIKQENLDKTKNEEKESSKYWICSTRDFLKFLNLFIETKNGLFYEYVSEYGSYMKVKSDTNPNNNKTFYQTIVPMNFPLTKAILNLFHSVFDFSHNLSIIVNENTSLDLIRMHYICFIKFYNKNLDFTEKIGDLNRLIENSTDKKKKIKQLIKDIYNDTNSLNLIICLCKLHLKCLFSLAKNRNSDVTNKFFQLRIVEVLVRELDLEHEANENTYKLQKYYESCKNTDKEQKDKIKMENLIKEKNKQELDKIINLKLEKNKEENPPEEEKKITVAERKPAANFKGIFKHKFKPKNQQNPQNISLNPNNDQPLIIEEKKTQIEENNYNKQEKEETTNQILSNFELNNENNNTIIEDITNFGQDELSDYNSQNSQNEKKNPFALNRKQVLLNMSKISSNQNHEFISMIDKTKTPVFNMNLGEKFNEIAQKAITEIITENKENNSVIIKSSNRDSSFNEDNEEFEDIPLCELLPKNKKYEDKIPKLDIPDSSIPVIHEPVKQEEKKEKPKVSFSNIFKKKEAPVFENKVIEQLEPLNEKKTSKDSFNEDHEEFDDIPLCEYQNKNNQYGNKIPKLELPHSNIGETGHASQNLPKIHEIKDNNKYVKPEEKKEVSVNKFKNIFNKKKEKEIPPDPTPIVNNNFSIDETNPKSSNRDNSFNENDEDFDDIPLCEHLPKNKQYEDKIPKLELPNTLSEIGLGGAVQKEEEKPKINLNKINFSLKKKENQVSTVNDNQKSDLSRSISNNEKKKTSRENSFNDDEEDFDDIPLCDLLPKNKQYGDKIPKLELPNTLSEVGLGGAAEEKSNIMNSGMKVGSLHTKNKSNTDIIKLNNSSNKFSLKQKIQNKSGVLSDFVLIDNEKNLHAHERKKSMPQNFLINSISLEKNEEDPKVKKVSLFKINQKDSVTKLISIKNPGSSKKPIVPVLNLTKKEDTNSNNDLSKDKSDNKSRDIEISDINKIDKSMRKNIPKIQVILEKILKKKYRLLYKKMNKDELLEEDIIDATNFYNKERSNRLLYHDSDLHVLIISIVICLILTPTRGTLEELYCSDYPLENGKINIFYLLHHHINHRENNHILPKLLRLVSEIKPFGAGQRMMKLLYKDLFDSTIFTQWTKIAAGAYGTVYQCQTNIAEPTTVAVKKMAVSESIFDRCRIHDIFTEITALETFRMEGCVTHLFDFGVDSDYYYIVMKMYPHSLKQWRVQQKGTFNEMLPIYLNIFKDILKAMAIIHNYKTTHYDIKCDNILLDYQISENTPVSSISNEENNMSVKIADFGECKMFINEQDEYCTRNRGTEYIKSPEMLNLGYNIRRDDDKFDRRKKIGTSRTSDIWSIGCLFYELLTGKYLFEDELTNDYFVFINKLNSNQYSILDLLTEDKLKELNNNLYIIDFLKFMLVKDPHSRPNIKTILSRYDHVHALLVSLGNPYSSKYMNSLSKRVNANVDTCFELCINMMGSKNLNGDYCQDYGNSSSRINYNLQYIPNLIKVTEDIYVCDVNFAENNLDVLLKLGITHIISWNKTKNKDITDRFLFFNLFETNSDIKKSSFYHIHKTMDFLRHCMIYRGTALFLDDYQYSNLSSKQNFLIRHLVILTISFILNLSAYDAWTYINSKILFFWLPANDLAMLSQWVMNDSIIINEIYSYPILKCLCGGCVIVLNRIFTNVSNIVIKTCNCSSKYKNTQLSECPSHGCFDYIQNIKNSYGLNYEYLQWGIFNSEDFFVGPGDIGYYNGSLHKRIMFSSRGIDENVILHSVNEKKLVKFINKKYYWNLYKCKICQIWMYAENSEKYYVLINNFYNPTKKIEQKKKLLKTNHLKNLKLSKLL